MTLVYFACDRPCGSFLVWLNISPFVAAGRSVVGSVASVGPCLQTLASPVFPFSCIWMWSDVAGGHQPV